MQIQDVVLEVRSLVNENSNVWIMVNNGDLFGLKIPGVFIDRTDCSKILEKSLEGHKEGVTVLSYYPPTRRIRSEFILFGVIGDKVTRLPDKYVIDSTCYCNTCSSNHVRRELKWV